MELPGSDWVNFKSRITYQPDAQHVGTRTLTLTVKDPDGHTDARTYVVKINDAE